MQESPPTGVNPSPPTPSTSHLSRAQRLLGFTGLELHIGFVELCIRGEGRQACRLESMLQEGEAVKDLPICQLWHLWLPGGIKWICTSERTGCQLVSAWEQDESLGRSNKVVYHSVCHLVEACVTEDSAREGVCRNWGCLRIPAMCQCSGFHRPPGRAEGAWT